MSLPSHYLITPGLKEVDTFFNSLEQSLRAGTRLMQFKGKGIDTATYARLAEKVIALAHDYQCKVLLTGDPEQVQSLGADGLHLDSRSLKSVSGRPLPESYLLAVSGHDLTALKQGEAIGADFAVLSPVKYTRAHPDIEPLGWEGFARIVSALKIPVYALGGVTAEGESTATNEGGQGIAGNKGYWHE